jgi:hypothetical protein
METLFSFRFERIGMTSKETTDNKSKKTKDYDKNTRVQIPIRRLTLGGPHKKEFVHNEKKEKIDKSPTPRGKNHSTNKCHSQFKSQS